jgi:hypothetical protein
MLVGNESEWHEVTHAAALYNTSIKGTKTSGLPFESSPVLSLSTLICRF